MTVRLYGIANCDTVRKSRYWLDRHSVAYAFHDYKKSGIDRAKLATWIDALGWTVVLNRAGTTFRKLNDVERSDLDGDKAIALMLAQPSMIKRPIVEYPGGFLVGFKAAEWEQVLSKSKAE